MRIHIHNPTDYPLIAISRTQWDAAAARAPGIGLGHEVSIGDTDDSFAAAIPQTEALITAAAIVREQFPTAAPRLRMIYFTSAGLDRLAPFDWAPPGVPLLNNRGAHGDKAGEFAIMAVLMLANFMPAFARAQQEQRWDQRHSCVLAGRRVTVVGLGTLGGAAAEQCARFGMDVTGVRTTAAPHPACARVVATDALDAMLPDTEFLVLACPLTPATRLLLNRERLGLLPAHAGVVNIGRGALLDQDALCDMLDRDALAGAVLDVFTPEPVPPGHRLWATRNLVMVPHVSADDHHSYIPRSLDIFLDNLRALRDGHRLPNLFDIDRGY